MTTTVGEREVWAALAGVPDPELPTVSVTEMGMVRGVDVTDERVTVRFVPTFSGCPALHVIRDGISEAVRALGVPDVQVQTVLSPPWSSDDITPVGREKLRLAGLAPPAPAGDGLITLDPAPTPCPRCGSLNTRRTATFGSALCKRMFVCNACQEPFEALKSI